MKNVPAPVKSNYQRTLDPNNACRPSILVFVAADLKFFANHSFIQFGRPEKNNNQIRTSS